MNVVSAEDFLQRAMEQAAPLIDVRSENEFEQGHIPGSQNLPILNTSERHLVGLSYKQNGQQAAIGLGQEITAPHKVARIEEWLRFCRKNREHETFITCWRGGLRSRIAQEWIASQSTSVTRVRGGYKALRRHLFDSLGQPFCGFVIMGLTGAGKTAFLRSLDLPSCKTIDLELMAQHRGSAFGKKAAQQQPATQTFENALGLALYQARAKKKIALLEDESRSIGKIHLLTPYWFNHRSLPCLFLDASLEDRCHNIWQEYVSESITAIGVEQTQERLLVSLKEIRNKLGGLEYQRIEGLLREAFLQPHQKSLAWIEALLERYYDPYYAYAQKRSGRKFLFRGNARELSDWLKQNATDTDAWLRIKAANDSGVGIKFL